MSHENLKRQEVEEYNDKNLVGQTVVKYVRWDQPQLVCACLTRVLQTISDLFSAATTASFSPSSCFTPATSPLVHPTALYNVQVSGIRLPADLRGLRPIFGVYTLLRQEAVVDMWCSLAQVHQQHRV